MPFSGTTPSGRQLPRRSLNSGPAERPSARTSLKPVVDWLLHIAPAGPWEAAKTVGRYEAPTLRSEGFIHLSRPDQVHLPANALYAETSDLLLLWIDPARLGSEIREEPPAPEASTTFPHLYGPLNVDAVLVETPLQPWKQGDFELPPTPPEP